MGVFERMLHAFGFSAMWVNLVMNIVSHCHYSFLINGETCGFVHAKQGLRQGDPISPALFILMNEYLSRSLNLLSEQNPFMYYKVPKGMSISHLAYVDDCVIFCNGSQRSVTLLKNFQHLYESQSGQEVNLAKSGCLTGERADSTLILNILNMSSMSFPFPYLGSPIYKGRKKTFVFFSTSCKD